MIETRVTVDGVEITTRRYVGWKEIMPYIQLGRRAIRRLEIREGFPLRRLKSGRGRVFVFSHEVEPWLLKHSREFAREKAALPLDAANER